MFYCVIEFVHGGPKPNGSQQKKDEKTLLFLKSRIEKKCIINQQLNTSNDIIISTGEFYSDFRCLLRSIERNRIVIFQCQFRRLEHVFGKFNRVHTTAKIE